MTSPWFNTPAMRDLRRAFERATGAAPTHAARAPGRVNLIGDHVDYAGGLVLPMAIEQSCLALAGRTAPRGRLRVHSIDLTEHVEVSTTAIAPGDAVPIGHWASYPIGAAAELASHVPGIDLDRFDIFVQSSVPIGAGLSSSAALEVAIAALVASVSGVEVDPVELAACCQRAERRFAGVPCGLMDQATSVLAREGSLLLFDCRDGTHRHVRSPEEVRYFVIDTRVRHAHAGGAYARRRRDAEDAAKALGVPTLRVACAEPWRSRLDTLPQAQRDAALHITSEIERVADAARALEDGDLHRLGRLMTESHTSLRDVYKVSCPELDAAVDAALACEGVLGARMTGGGFGGCAIALLDANADANFLVDFPYELAARSQIKPTLFEVRPSGGASATPLPADDA
ncbi:MAG: galactokinase [Phycisphaerales bacterium]